MHEVACGRDRVEQEWRHIRPPKVDGTGFQDYWHPEEGTQAGPDRDADGNPAQGIFPVHPASRPRHADHTRDERGR